MIKIKVEIIDNHIFLEGMGFSATDIAELIGVNYVNLSVYVKKYKHHSIDRISNYINDHMWKTHYNVPANEAVFTNPDGDRCVRSLVISETGLSNSTVNKRLVKWSEGLIDYDKLYDPCVEPLKKRGTRKIKTDEERSIEAENKAARKEASKRMLSNMQPRQETWEIKQSGKWEKEKKGVSVRPHKCVPASSTHGSWYFGD